MTYDKQYYDNRKQELQQDNLKNIVETYDEFVRLIQKSTTKTQEISQKYQKLIEEEKVSKGDKQDLDKVTGNKDTK